MHTIIIALALLLTSPAFAQSEVSGTCRVVDGDTVFAESVQVRLQGVAAPEDPREPGGKEATAYMRQICEGQQVRCVLDGSKTRGREVGICYVGDRDIGAEVIAAGLAINFGPWQGQIFKVSIWSEGLATISKKPDSSWVGKWVSVVGLMEPPYVSRRYKYSHLSINVSSNGQITAITETEAKFRLESVSTTKRGSVGTSNKVALERIKGRSSSAPSSGARAQSTSASANQNVLNNIRKTQGTAQSSSQQAQTAQSHLPRSTYTHKPQEKGLLGKLFDWLFG